VVSVSSQSSDTQVLTTQPLMAVSFKKNAFSQSCTDKTAIFLISHYFNNNNLYRLNFRLFFAEMQTSREIEMLSSQLYEINYLELGQN